MVLNPKGAPPSTPLQGDPATLLGHMPSKTAQQWHPAASQQQQLGTPRTRLLSTGGGGCAAAAVESPGNLRMLTPDAAYFFQKQQTGRTASARVPPPQPPLRQIVLRGGSAHEQLHPGLLAADDTEAVAGLQDTLHQLNNLLRSYDAASGTCQL